jgi:transcriptional regulator with XRE-family HTH domain
MTMERGELFSPEIVGERLRLSRRERKLTQQKLAQQMQIPQSWVSELETGKQSRLQAETVYRFCRALGVSADYLLGLTDDLQPRAKSRRKRAPQPAAGVGEPEEDLAYA